MSRTNRENDSFRERAAARFKRKTLSTYGMSIVYILMGIFLFIKPGTALTVICSLIGAALLIYGIVVLIRYFRTADLLFQSPLPGILLIVIGAIFLFAPYAVTGFARFIIAVTIFGTAVSELVEVDTLRAYNDSRWYLCLLSGIISIIFSFVILFYPVENVVVMIIGVALIYTGITGILFNHRAARFIKNASATFDEAVRNARDAASGRPHYDASGKEIIDGTATVEDSDHDSF